MEPAEHRFCSLPGRPGRSMRWRIVVPTFAIASTLAFAGTNAALGAPENNDDSYLLARCGFDGMVLQGGVMPLRVDVRFPEAAATEGLWSLRVTPRGGPWSWSLIIPLPVEPGRSRRLDQAVPLHPRDREVRVELVDAQNQIRAERIQRPALLSPRWSLGLKLGRERGVRRIAGADARVASVAWVRLPAHLLPGRAVALHDVVRILGQPRGDADARSRRQLERWGESYDRELLLDAETVSAALAPWTVGLAWEGARRVFRELLPPRDASRSLPALALVILVAGLAAMGHGLGRRHGTRTALVLGAVAALLSGGWLALGMPRGPARLVPIFQLREGPDIHSQWSLNRYHGGPGSGGEATWPEGAFDLIGPVRLPEDGTHWELSWFEPGLGQERWELRGPGRGASSLWAGLRLLPAGEPVTNPVEVVSDLQGKLDDAVRWGGRPSPRIVALELLGTPGLLLLWPGEGNSNTADETGRVLPPAADGG